MIREQNLQVTDAPNMAYDAVLTAGNFKPILFSTPMVQAILRGEKTQTRRIMQEQPPCQLLSCGTSGRYWADNPEDLRAKYFRCKYEIGDILWVRETWAKTGDNFHDDWERKSIYYFKADNPFNEKELHENYPQMKGFPKWRPSIFMPKEACRIFLKLKSIRVERLNDISESDAIAEGVERWIEERMKSKPTHYKVYYQNCKPEDLMSYTSCPIDSYETLWQKINGEKSWDENPFVWVYEFERTDASFACS